MAWQLTVEGQVLHEDDLTLAECERIETMTGENWANIHPLRSAKHGRAVLQVLFARNDPDGAEVKASAFTVKGLLAAFETVEDDRPSEYADGIPQQGDGGQIVG